MTTIHNSTIYQWSNRCPKCGKPYTYVGDPIGDISDLICTCHQKMIEQIIHPQGWQCPICGKVMAPWMPTCPGEHTTTIATNTANWTSE